MSTEFYWVAVVATTILAASRLTRLATWDHFPPVEWARTKYGNFTDKHAATRGWTLLAYCGYCASFWITLIVVGLGAVGHVYGHPPNGDQHWTYYGWWVLMGSLAMSYLAAVFMANDGDEGDD